MDENKPIALLTRYMRLNDSIHITLTICPREACTSKSARGFWLDPASGPVQTPAATGTWHRIWNIINMPQEVMPTAHDENQHIQLERDI